MKLKIFGVIYFQSIKNIILVYFLIIYINVNYLYFFLNFQNLEELLKNFYVLFINDKRLGNDYFFMRSFFYLKFVDMFFMKIEVLVNVYVYIFMIFFIELCNYVLLQMY